MLLIVVFLVAGVFIEGSHESNLPSMPDLPDINATPGQGVTFKFTEKFNFSISQCEFGINAGKHVAPKPVLLLLSWPIPSLKRVDKYDKRTSFVGQASKDLWINFANLTTNDTNAYRMYCTFSGGVEANATAKLNVQDAPVQPDSSTSSPTTAVTTHIQATKTTTSRSSKSSGNFFSMGILVMAGLMPFIKM